jgi:hypothetical protein
MLAEAFYLFKLNWISTPYGIDEKNSNASVSTEALHNEVKI